VIYRFAGTAFGGASTPTNNNRYSERRTGGQLGFTREVKQDYFGNVALRTEHIKTSNLTTTVNDSFIQQDGDVSLLTLAMTRNKRDVDIDPSRGEWIRLSVDPGHSNITEVGGANPDPSILGSNYFLKQNLEIRQYWSPHQKPRLQDLDSPRRVIAARLRYGRIEGKVPFFEQYFVGGSETIRGYAEDRFWGKQQLLTTLEYRHPVQKSFNIVTFVDWGTAWGGYGTVNSFTQSDKLYMHLGYGAGLSFKTPLGPIKLDIGFDNHGKSRAHFLIGTSF
jgi:outer membrane protein insertion porin family